jgi:hypothetical protein
VTRTRAARFAGIGRATVAAAALASTAACATMPARIPLPSGPGEPLADPVAIGSQAFGHCAGVRTLTAEIGVSGRAGGQKLRAKLIAGFEAPASLRLEAVAPFGAPGFILAADGTSATLLLPRDDRVLTGAAPADILDALAGLSLSPGDLRLALAGCPSAAPQVSGGTTHDREWTVLGLGAGGTAYLRSRGGSLQLAAFVRPGLVVEYPERRAGGAPAVVRLRGEGDAPRFDVSLRLSQVEQNVDVPPEAFRVNVPDDAVPITLEELRQAGPLGETRNAERGVRN